MWKTFLLRFEHAFNGYLTPRQDLGSLSKNLPDFMQQRYMKLLVFSGI